jgi:anaerobic selenocysteine-containing dehydrogenase
MTTTHHRACNLCEAICGLTIEVENGKIMHIEGDKNDPLSKGHICPKAFALKDIHEDPNRLKFPMKRTEDGWQQISWEAAFDEIEGKMKDIQTQYGTNAVGIYHGNPSIHNLGTMTNTGGLIKSFKTKNNFSATSTDQLPHHFASWLMFGHPMLLPVPDISRTDFMLIIGGNPLASNGSMMTAPDVGGHLKNIQKRGGKVVVIDPRKTETAEKADVHHFIKPGSDAFLLLSLIHVLFKENKVNLGKNASYTEGVEVLRQISEDFSPEKIAFQTGISAENIRQLALDFAAAKSAICYGRVGVSTQAFGGLCQWLINCINILTDNFDKEGGVMFAKPAIDILMGMQPRNIFGRWKSRVRGLNEFMGELSVSVMSEEILTEGEGQIRAMITNCGNPILSTPNGEQLDKAFAQLDFMVAIDIYLNETTRHAHIILPPATGVENSHYDITFNVLSVRNTAKYSPPMVAKPEGMKYDWEIMQELAHRMAGEGEFVARAPEKLLDKGLQYGPYSLRLQDLIDKPSGIDLGELQPCLPERLIHADKKIQLAPDLLVHDIERLKKLIQEAPPQYFERNFQLIGRRNLRDNNSWLHNSAKLMRGHNRCTLMLHPEDAVALGVVDKSLVKVTSRVGSVEVLAEVTDHIMRGVVSLPHGYGHARKGINLEVAEQFAGVSVNDLTDEMVLDDLTGNVAFSNVVVSIEKSEMAHN